MANVLTQGILHCDSLGIVATGPVWVKAINFIAINTQTFTLRWWDEKTPAVSKRGITYTVTTSTDDTVTSTGNFTSAWAAGKVAKCLKTTGSDSGVYGLIKTIGNNDRFITHLSPFTTEANKVGDWDCYTSYVAVIGKQPEDTNEESKWMTFGGRGFRFPNLALDVLDGGTVTIYVA